MTHVRRGTLERGRRQMNAYDREVARHNRTNKQQLARLDLRPGNSTKERARLV